MDYFQVNNSLDLTDNFDLLSHDNIIKISMQDLKLENILGEGSYGTVYKARHTKSDRIFAIKIIRPKLDGLNKDILKDLHIARDGQTCPFIIDSYGAMYCGGDIWICMDIMDTSLDTFYKKLVEFIPEEFLVYIIFCMVSALWYLHRKLSVIHRDVKPSNILIDCKGRVQVCDFGISGFLVNSVAMTKIGSNSYLAPERLDYRISNNAFDIRSDVWSLGLTVLEVAIKRFPYNHWPLLIDQLRDVVMSDVVPTLPGDAPYSNLLGDFISKCLVKNRSFRANYDELLNHDLLMKLRDNEDTQSRFGAYVSETLK